MEKLTESQITTLLLGLLKGETVDEIARCRKVFEKTCCTIAPQNIPRRLCNCGSGGINRIVLIFRRRLALSLEVFVHLKAGNRSPFHRSQVLDVL